VASAHNSQKDNESVTGRAQLVQELEWGHLNEETGGLLEQSQRDAEQLGDQQEE
jgi:hypothetical protein